PVFAASSENDESDSTTSDRPVTLHNFSSGVKRRGEGGRKQAADNICNHPKARHPRVRMDSPCSLSFGGGNLTLPGTLAAMPVRCIEQFIRNEIGVRISPAFGFAARDDDVLRDVHKRCTRAVCQRDVDAPLFC